MRIRNYQAHDWAQLWPILSAVFHAGETYAFSPDISEEAAFKVWVTDPQETFVATNQDDKLLGTYFIKPNQPALGSHVCNCGYIVSEEAQGKGIASRLCEHSQERAIQLGFRAMQYNLVVSSNVGAIHLWKKLGFQTVGILPKAFNSKRLGYIDALVMYKQLVNR